MPLELVISFFMASFLGYELIKLNQIPFKQEVKSQIMVFKISLLILLSMNIIDFIFNLIIDVNILGINSFSNFWWRFDFSIFFILSSVFNYLFFSFISNRYNYDKPSFNFVILFFTFMIIANCILFIILDDAYYWENGLKLNTYAGTTTYAIITYILTQSDQLNYKIPKEGRNLVIGTGLVTIGYFLSYTIFTNENIFLIAVGFYLIGIILSIHFTSSILKNEMMVEY